MFINKTNYFAVMKCTSVTSLSSRALLQQPRVGGAKRALLRQKVVAIAEPVSRGSAVPFQSSSEHLDSWTPTSWRNYKALQQPEYPSVDEFNKVTAEISRMPPLVFAGECRTLQTRLAQVG